MIALLLIIIAAICKAVADTIAHHYYDSMFNGSKFFNPNRVAKSKKLISLFLLILKYLLPQYLPPINITAANTKSMFEKIVLKSIV